MPFGKKAPTPPLPPPIGPTGLGVLEDPVVYQWAFGLLAAHVLIRAVLTSFRHHRPETSTLAKCATMPGLVAHQLVILVPFTYAAFHGLVAFFSDAEMQQLAHANASERLYNVVTIGWHLTRFMAGFQLYDLTVTALEKEVCKTEHLLHHSFALATALVAAANGGPWCTYYSVFFFAVVEVSSVPLVAVDLYRGLPSLLKDPLHNAINEVCRIVFALSFLFVRCVCFPLLMILQLWPDLYAVYVSSDVRVSAGAFSWLAFASIVLTGLQLFWGYKIVRVISKGNLKGKDAKAMAKETN